MLRKVSAKNRFKFGPGHQPGPSRLSVRSAATRPLLGFRSRHFFAVSGQHRPPEFLDFAGAPPTGRRESFLWSWSTISSEFLNPEELFIRSLFQPEELLHEILEGAGLAAAAA